MMPGQGIKTVTTNKMLRCLQNVVVSKQLAATTACWVTGCLAASVVGSVSGSQAHASSFDVNWLFTSDFTQEQKDIIQEAGSTWAGFITGYQSASEDLTGLTVTVRMMSNNASDGSGGRLAYAINGSKLIRDGFSYAKTGSIYIDPSDIGHSLLPAIARHEIGHLFGIGTYWDDHGLVARGSGRYTGEAALEAYQQEFGLADATYVPVELDGGTGTAELHWDELSGIKRVSDGKTFAQELMTGYLNSGSYISQTTIASLYDLGYTIWDRGDFDHSGLIDGSDIDTLYSAVNEETANVFYDLDDDGNAEQDDLDVLIEDILGTRYGDANLDGQVSLLDLDILGSNYGQAGGWSQGDFNGDGMVTLLDLDILGSNYGSGGIQTASLMAYLDIPEPATLSLLALGALGMGRRRKIELVAN